MSTEKKFGESLIGFSPLVILRLAQTYPRLIKVVLEMVQNAIDKNAKTIWINVNRKNKDLSVADDGDGTTPQYFGEAVSNIGKTTKGIDKLGRFGLGVISPVDKCTKYTFTSTPRGKSEYCTWTFEQAVIRREEPKAIVFEERPDLVFGNYTGTKKGVGRVEGVPWRTQAKLEKLTIHKLMSEMTPDNLCAEILDNYNRAMARKGVRIILTYIDENGERTVHEVRAKEFEGEPIAVKKFSSRYGDTTFRLFLAQKRGKKREKARVVVGEQGNDFRVTFDSFCKTLPGGIKLSPEAREALNSGVFEGEILSSHCKWHHEREGFQVDNALEGFCKAIEEWYKEVGSQHYARASEGERENFLRELAERSLEKLSRLVDTKYGSPLRELINSFDEFVARDNQGFGGAEEGEGKKTPSAKPKESSGSSGGKTPTRKTPDSKNGGGDEPEKGHSKGIHLYLKPLVASSKLYEVDSHKGVIIINVRHSLWLDCEHHGRRTMERYQDFLLLESIAALSMPDDSWQEMCHLATEAKAPLAVWFFKEGDKVSRELADADRVKESTKSVVIRPKK